MRRYSEKLDRRAPKSFRLSPAEIDAAIGAVGKDDRAQIAYCREQAAFAEPSVAR